MNANFKELRGLLLLLILSKPYALHTMEPSSYPSYTGHCKWYPSTFPAFLSTSSQSPFQRYINNLKPTRKFFLIHLASSLYTLYKARFKRPY